VASNSCVSNRSIEQMTDLRSCSLSLLTDIDFLPVSLDATRFPGAPSDIKIHQGFRDAHYDTALPILNETQRLIKAKGADNVVLVRSLSNTISSTSFSLPSLVSSSLYLRSPHAASASFSRHLLESLSSLRPGPLLVPSALLRPY
jgi:hypothetical protein